MAILGIITGVIALAVGIFAIFKAAEATRIAGRVKSINDKYEMISQILTCNDHHNH